MRKHYWKPLLKFLPIVKLPITSHRDCSLGGGGVNTGVRIGNDWAPMIALDDYKGMPNLVAITKTYLQGQVKAVEQCASTLV